MADNAIYLFPGCMRLDFNGGFDVSSNKYRLIGTKGHKFVYRPEEHIIRVHKIKLRPIGSNYIIYSRARDAEFYDNEGYRGSTSEYLRLIHEMKEVINIGREDNPIDVKELDKLEKLTFKENNSKG